MALWTTIAEVDAYYTDTEPNPPESWSTMSDEEKLKRMVQAQNCITQSNLFNFPSTIPTEVILVAEDPDEVDEDITNTIKLALYEQIKYSIATNAGSTGNDKRQQLRAAGVIQSAIIGETYAPLTNASGSTDVSPKVQAILKDYNLRNTFFRTV